MTACPASSAGLADCRLWKCNDLFNFSSILTHCDLPTHQLRSYRRILVNYASLHDHSGEHVGLQHHQNADEAGQHDRVAEDEAQDRALMPEPVGGG
jgi:hypothetical protein